MKWAKGEFKAQSEGGAIFDIKAFSVLKEYAQQVFFTQYGLSKDADSSTLNLGLGFNHLMPKAILPLDIVIGGTAFYDARTGTDSILNPFGEGVHKRFSVGGTIMTSQAGVFFNIYKGLSESIGGYKASDGYDFGVNGLVPTLESVNLGVTMYEFNEENKGSKFKIEYKPNSFFTFGAEQDQSDNPSTSLYIETKYKFNTPFEEQLAPIASASNDVWSKRYDEVERDNTIILESHEKGVEVLLVEALTAEWGGNIQIPEPIGGGIGKITYDIKKNALQQNTAEEEIEEEKIVVSDTGVVSGAKKPQTVVVIVSRASDGDYSASSTDVEVTFKRKGSTKDSNFVLNTQAVTSKEWGENIDIPAPTSEATGGSFSYAVTSDPSNTGAKIVVDDVKGAKLTGAKGAGTVIVTTTRAQDKWYSEASKDLTVTFDKRIVTLTPIYVPDQTWSEDGFDIRAYIIADNGYTGPYKYTITRAGAGASLDGNIIKTTKKGHAYIKVEVATDDWEMERYVYVDIMITTQDSSVILPPTDTTVTVDTAVDNNTTHNYVAIKDIIQNNINSQTVIMNGAMGDALQPSEVTTKLGSDEKCFRSDSTFYVKKGADCDLFIKINDNDKYKRKIAILVLRGL